MDSIYDVRPPVITYWLRTPEGQLSRASSLQDILRIAGNVPYALCDNVGMWNVDDNIIKLLKKCIMNAIKQEINDIKILEVKFIDEFCFNDWDFYPITEKTKFLMLDYMKTEHSFKLPTYSIENGYAKFNE